MSLKTVSCEDFFCSILPTFYLFFLCHILTHLTIGKGLLQHETYVVGCYYSQGTVNLFFTKKKK